MLSPWRWKESLLAALVSVPAFGQVTINEVMAENKSLANWDGTISDWVELYNPSAQPVPLSGWSLTDSASNPRKWVFPGVTLPAGGYLLIALDSGRAASTSAGGLLNAGFGVKGTGDNVILFNGQSAVIDSLRFGPQAADYSIGAMPAGSGNFVLTTPTPGSANIAQALGPQSALRINEWMASPATGEDWFEVFNGSALPAPLSGLYFVDSSLEPSPVAPLSFIGVGREGFTRFFADNSTNDNEVDFKLGAGGDSIGLYANNGTRIDLVEFGAQQANVSQGRLPDGSANIQTLNLATPAGSNLLLYDGLWVNEILTHTDPPFEDAVEFWNDTDSELDLSGWYLSNSRSDLTKYRLPAGTKIPAKGYLVLYENQFNGAGAQDPFTFNSAHGDRVVLSQASSGGTLSGYLVEQEFEAAGRNVPLGRYPTSVAGVTRFVPLQTPTFGVSQPASLAEFRTGRGAANSGPRVGPVVIAEIMYNPGAAASTGAPSDPDEYLKLTNLEATPVALYDAGHDTNTWKIAKGISFDFPRFTTIPANGSILVVSFDPQADTAQAAAFRAKYSVPVSAPLHGPFSGKLDNSGEAVALYRPDEPQGPEHPDAGFVPYLLVDRVDYLDVAPWPPEADGMGQSLQRKVLAAFGNDPANWLAAAPAAGQGTGDTKIELAARRDRGSIAITFEAAAGQSYSLQARANLDSGTLWETIASSTATGNAGAFSDPIAPGTKRFYRVVSPAAP